MSSSRIDSLEALRGLAAAAVTWFHFTNGNKAFLKDGWLKTSGCYGWLGVEVFFVISGFVIPYSLWRGRYALRDCGTFLLKRFIRLHPPYLASVVVVLALWYLTAAMPGFRGEPPQVGATDLLLHFGYLCDFFDRPWLNPVYWTLAIEAQFYVLTAFTFPVLVAENRLARYFGPCLLAALGAIPGEHLVFGWMPLFAFGMIAFQRHAGLVSLPVAGASALVVATIGFGMMEGLKVAVGLSTALAILYCELPVGRILRFLGAISYSLYLLHVPIGGRVINIGTRLPETAFTAPAVLLAAGATSLAAAWILYRFIERPSASWSSALKYGAVTHVSSSTSSTDPQSVVAADSITA